MRDLPRRGFRFWLRRNRASVSDTPSAPPSAQEFAEKLTELTQFERGIAALYYLLPDEALAQQAQRLCEIHRSQSSLEPGVERELRAKEPLLASWSAASAAWRSDLWEPGEIMAIFGFRVIEGLRAQPEVWGVIVDPHAQFFGLAAAKDEEHRFWLVLVTGRTSGAAGPDMATAAR